MDLISIRGRRGVGLALGLLLPPGLAAGQGLPDPLPPLPPGAGPVLAVEAAPRMITTSPPVQVPPGGPAPTWAPPPIDPPALYRHPPKHVDAKARSWRWRRTQGKFWGYPEEYCPRPLGASLYDHGRAMVANGAAARLILLRYDFVDGSSELNDRGIDQLARASVQLASSPYPLLIERDPDHPGLAERRRLTVLAALASGPMPVPSDRVLVGQPIAHGLAGIEAHIINDNALNRTEQYGPPIPINSNGVNSPSGVTNSQ
ncbi:hypothetical protein TA3x_003889 [Tundrisphaera sp. TA3]|uniref:hypothetical protein n=1 Tax=Tundrisphaera sp. TA3 TaxID=3435775 RepID=UPI003EBBA0F9